eukprot:2424397-Rhodomonas_salina.2
MADICVRWAGDRVELFGDGGGVADPAHGRAQDRQRGPRRHRGPVRAALKSNAFESEYVVRGWT